MQTKYEGLSRLLAVMIVGLVAGALISAFYGDNFLRQVATAWVVAVAFGLAD